MRHAVRVGEGLARLDAHQHFLRVGVLRGQVVAVVGDDQGHVHFPAPAGPAAAAPAFPRGCRDPAISIKKLPGRRCPDTSAPSCRASSSRPSSRSLGRSPERQAESAMSAFGVGAHGNRTLGTASIGGMLIGMICQIFIVPALFVIFQYLQEKVKPMEWEDIDNADAVTEIEQYAK